MTKHPTVLERAVVTTGDVKVTDTYFGPGCTSTLFPGVDTLQMTLEPNDGNGPNVVRLKFSGARSWHIELACRGQPDPKVLGENTFTDLLGRAMEGYRNIYGDYSFDPAWTLDNPSIGQCLLRYGHYDGQDVMPFVTFKVTLDLYVTRGHCPFVDDLPGAAD